MIKLIEMLTICLYLFEFFLRENVIPINLYYILQGYGEGVSIMEFNQVKVIKLIEIITFYYDFLESFPLESVIPPILNNI